MNIKRPDNELLIQLIKAKNGNYTEIAKALGVARRTVSEWVRGDEELKLAYEDANESLLDFCETQSMLLIKGIPKIKKNPQTGKEEIVGWEEKPSESMLKYILSTKGKHRGYTEKTEVDVTSKGEKLMGWVIETVPKKEYANSFENQ